MTTMRRALVAATLVVSSAGAARVGAGSSANLKGSDTLFGFASAMIAACPGTAGPYLGEALGDGESAMLAGNQQVAPMSNFLDSSVCIGPAAAPSGSQGLVIGLDSVVLVGSDMTFGGNACNGDVNLNCASTFEPLTGAAYDTTITWSTPSPGSYTFTGWRDVLRVLLAGFDHDHVGIGSGAWSARDCFSPARQALANGYGLFFENRCTATSGEATLDQTYNPVCTQIRHVFRLGDFSSATDTVVALLGLPSVVHPETTVVSDVSGTATTLKQHTGASPFCNAVRPAFVFPSPQPKQFQSSVDNPVEATWDPTSTDPAANGLETAVYRAVFQNNDPIRRRCAGSGTGGGPAEDVCSHSGDLGLVLPINDVQELEPRTNADRYNATPCSRSTIASVTPPDVYDAITQRKVICGDHGLLCPNGDLCNNFGGCFAPADAGGSPQCLASLLTTPVLTVSGYSAPIANPRLPSLSDGRSYNQHLYVLVGTAGAYQQQPYQVGTSVNNLPVTGAYFRIHTTHSLSPASPAPTCQLADMSDEIGCLVTASPCSVGYAGRNALTGSASGPIKLDRQSPELACIQGRFLYPLSRKLYFNSVPGFAAVNGQELQLTGCMTDLAQPGLTPTTPGGLLTTELAAAGFIPMPSFVNRGEPFCEDFDEQTMCGAAFNVDACRSRPGALVNFPTFETVCGDGLRDPYEDCDDGAGNGPPPATCSSSCRLNR